ncbi:hypothetical protein RchiOBHm_Chr5g0002231 [Rosa chinensis]|uniref:Uncharacterized protein n=1 Tax=Rosa chinensis TaxID=74649 RepID=A0A2P6Q2F6_ROSCH|nr:uncharacterized protein LOC112202414 [Rosa chinensis]PRQ28361.1 hypothetical protein RchiOBHm_Chr5g0002231 [Rosa chinensis]
MTDVESRNPNLDRPAKRRVEELDEDDLGKSPKQTKRRREEFDESAAGTGNGTLWNKEPPMVDDGSADGFPLVLPQKEDKGSGGNEDSDVEEVSSAEEDSDPPEFILNCGGGLDEGDYFGYCELCVDNEVCKGCGNKDGSPVREE